MLFQAWPSMQRSQNAAVISLRLGLHHQISFCGLWGWPVPCYWIRELTHNWCCCVHVRGEKIPGVLAYYLYTILFYDPFAPPVPLCRRSELSSFFLFLPLKVNRRVKGGDEVRRNCCGVLMLFCSTWLGFYWQRPSYLIVTTNMRHEMAKYLVRCFWPREAGKREKNTEQDNDCLCRLIPTCREYARGGGITIWFLPERCRNPPPGAL